MLGLQEMKNRPFWYLEYKNLMPLAEAIAGYYNERCKYSQVDPNELYTAIEKAKNTSVRCES